MKYILLIALIIASNSYACNYGQPCYQTPQQGYNAASTPQVYSHGKYLGNLNNNQYDPNSVSNPYGKYGSEYSPDSINNPYGKYGSEYSNQSANNPYATDAPKVYVNDRYNSSLNEYPNGQ